MWSPQTARQQPHGAIAHKGAVMNRNSPDHVRRPTCCPRSPGQPMIALPDPYLDLMFGDLPDEPLPETVDDGEAEARSGELVA